MSTLSSRIEQQCAHRLASWSAMALERLSMADEVTLQMPSDLEAAVSTNIKALSWRLTREHMERSPADRDRAMYREALNRIYALADECHAAWARSVLKHRRDLAEFFEALAAAMIAISPKAGEEEISEVEVMKRLYALDLEMAAHNMAPGTDDWYPIRRAFQTQQAFLSPGYVISLRSLIGTKRVAARKDQDGTIYYRQDPMLYNWAFDRLDQMKGSDWAESFLLISLESVKISNKTENK